MLQRFPRVFFAGVFAIVFLSMTLLAPFRALAQTPPSAQASATASGSSAALPAKIDTGDTAWMLVSTALVLLMTPGLALFYGGMVRRKNVLGTMMHSFIMMAMVSVIWALYGYSLAFHKGSFWGGFWRRGRACIIDWARASGRPIWGSGCCARRMMGGRGRRATPAS